MKRVLWIVFGLISLSAQAADVISIAAADSLKSYQSLLADVVKRAGFELNFVLLPQARLIKELESGRYDGALMLSDFAINTLPGMTRVPVSLGQGQQAAVTIRADIQIKTPQDLAKYYVGIERGNKSQEILRPHLKEFYEARNSSSLFAMLAVGRLDVVIAPPIRVAAYAKEANIDRYYIQQPSVVVFPLYLALTLGGSAFEPRLTPVFRAAVASGEWGREVKAIQARFEEEAGAAAK